MKQPPLYTATDFWPNGDRYEEVPLYSIIIFIVCNSKVLVQHAGMQLIYNYIIAS